MPGTTVGVWGTYDLENYGDHLFPLIARRELRARLPDVDVRVFSPFGWEHPTVLEGGHQAEPLGPRGPVRCVELAQELDCVLVGGGEIIHTRDELLGAAYGVSGPEMSVRRPSQWFIGGLGKDLEDRCPVLWHGVGLPFNPTPEESAELRDALAHRPYISVRDVFSLERLQAAEISAEITLVPDSGFLVKRLHSEELLDRRRRFHQDMGWVPVGDQPYLVVQGNRDLVKFVYEIASALRMWRRAHPEVPVVVAELGPCHGDDEFASALAPLIEPVYRFPSSAGVIDIVSLLSRTRSFVGISLHGSITTFAYGGCPVIVNLNSQSKLEGLATSIGGAAPIARRVEDLAKTIEDAWFRMPDATPARLEAELDVHFDRIAEIVTASVSGRGDGRFGMEDLGRQVDRLSEESAILRLASRRRAERMVDERVAMAARLESERTAAAASIAAIQRELEQLRSTRTFRYTARVRSLYGRLRRLRTQ